jgi:hypothetical protein
MELVRRAASRAVSTKSEYRTGKANWLGTNREKKNTGNMYRCRGVNELEEGYQPTNNTLVDENSDLLADSLIFICSLFNDSFSAT